MLYVKEHMMSDSASDFDPVALEVFDFFRRQPGEAFAVDAIASEIGYDADEVRAGLFELLERDLIIEQGIANPTYRLSDAAPEL
jgi:hypothetical protein